MKNCKYCGKEIEEDSLFCRHCGKQVCLSTEVTDEELANAVADEYGVLYSKDGKKLLVVEACIREYSIKDGTKVICDNAFDRCTMAEVTIPNSVTQISNSAFCVCREFRGFEVEEGNEHYCSVDGVLFTKDMTMLIRFPCISSKTSYIVPESVTTIGNSAFCGCRGLTEVAIPNSVTSIGDDAFSACGLTKLSIPDSVTKIGIRAFHCCLDLTEAIIGNSVTEIGQLIFYHCTSLLELTIGKSVAKILGNAFSGCHNVESITSLTSKPPMCVGGVFCYIPTEICVLNIPEGLREAYSRAEEWREFKNIREIDVTTSDSSPVYNLEVDGIYYNLFGSEATVTSGHGKYSGEVIIPKSITYNGRNYSVTSIGDKAFYDCWGLEKVTIPDSVTIIGDKAFNRSSELTEVVIPNSVTEIESCAFKDCSSLTQITIPDGVTMIPYEAFSGCVYLTSVTIGNSVTMIDGYAFYNCYSLTQVSIPDSVTVIDYSAFEECAGLKQLTIGSAVTEIGTNAFNRCFSLTGELILPNGITRIPKYAFGNCSSLTQITIPESVTEIESHAFEGCSGLTQFDVDEDNEFYCAVDGVLFTKDMATLIQFPAASSLTSYNIPESVTSISDFAFEGCKGLKNITIPESVTSIGEWAFCGCTELTDLISLNPEPPTCDSNVFYGVPVGTCTLHVPEGSAEEYNNYQWEEFENIEEFEEGTLSISDCGKQVCLSTEVTDEELANAVADGYEVLYSKNGRRLLKCENHTLTEYTVREGTEVICDSAFQDYTILTKVTIPSSVTSIGEWAFDGCKGLKSIKIPESVTKISNYAFCECSNLTQVTIPKGVTSMGYQTFSGCTGLTQAAIGAGAIGGGTFYNCTSLTEVAFGDNVTTIGYKAFAYCTGLTSINIPNNVTTIAIEAFSGCMSLREVTIGMGVDTIGGDAFHGCTGLKCINILNPKPPTCGTLNGKGAFYTVNKGTCILYVPEGSAEAYNRTSEWRTFTHIVEKPNDWAKAMRSGNFTAGDNLRLEFWTAFKEYAEKDKEMSNLFKLRKPRPENWYDLSVGSSSYYISLVVSLQNHKVKAGIYIPDNKDIYNNFCERKQDTEKLMGTADIDWNSNESAKASSLYVSKDVDVNERENWPAAFGWLRDQCVTLKALSKEIIP